MKLFHFLTQEYPLDKAFFVVPKRLLKFNGIWPFTKITLRLILFDIWTSSCLAIGGAAEFAFVFTHLNDPMNALDGVCPATTISMTFFKYMYIVYNRKEYRESINRCEELFFADKELDQDLEKKRLVTHPMSVTSVLCFGTFMFAFMTNLTYCSRPLITMAYQHFTNQNITMLMPFFVYLPDRFLTMPIYPLTYVVVANSGLTTVNGIGGIDGSCISFCLYVAAMFKSIQYDLQKMFKRFAHDDERILISDEEVRIIRKKLGALIERHNDIMDAFEKFRSVFAVIIFGHFFSAAITICCGLLSVMLGSGYNLCIYVFYVGCVLSQLFIYCYGGTMISEESEKIAEAAYFCHWYRADVKIRKMICIIMTRTQKPVVLAVPFFSPSLPAFSSICGTAGSYITLLRTFI